MAKLTVRVSLLLIIFSLTPYFLFDHSNEALAAAFSLSVRPYEGGFNLDFGKLTPASIPYNKEVTVSITSDIAKQYRLAQYLVEPLTSTQGATIPANNFTVYGIRGSNRSGTFSIQEGAPVGMARQIIYTSDSQGSSDSFTLVYNLNVAGNIEPGSYRGRISFTLEPVSSAQNPVIVILNVFSEIQINSSIEVKTSRGTNLIFLKPEKENNNSDVFVNIKGTLGKQFRILQLVEQQPASPENNYLDWQAVKFSGSGSHSGMVINENTSLSDRQQVIYTSSPSGDSDSFIISYNLADLGSQRAGVYKSKIKYILEGMGFGQPRLITALDLQIENPRIFELVVSPETGGAIKFSNLNPNEPPKIQEVIFEVKSNIAKQYQVTQNMGNLLTNKEGLVIPEEYFSLKEDVSEVKGTLKYPQETRVKQGQMVLFISDKEGSADKFKVTYELNAPRDIHSGEYFTNFTYTVSEI